MKFISKADAPVELVKPMPVSRTYLHSITR
jgi:hypothetical protein